MVKEFKQKDTWREAYRREHIATDVLQLWPAGTQDQHCNSLWEWEPCHQPFHVIIQTLEKTADLAAIQTIILQFMSHFQINLTQIRDPQNVDIINVGFRMLRFGEIYFTSIAHSIC